MAARLATAMLARMGSREAKVYGLHACLAIFRQRPEDIQRVFCSEARVPELRDVLNVDVKQP